jgi:hypothetical protein
LRGAVFCGGVVCSGGCDGCFSLVNMLVVIIMAITAVVADRIVGVGGYSCDYYDWLY